MKLTVLVLNVSFSKRDQQRYGSFIIKTKYYDGK
jgi:hypothetical protein